MSCFRKILKKIIGEKNVWKIVHDIHYIKRSYRYKHWDREKDIKDIYYNKTGKKLNLDTPKTFNEKVNWLKLNWYDPIATDCVDKYKVRKVVEEKDYGHLLNELYAVYDSPEDIEWDNLPEEYILKTNNGCGGHVIKRKGQEVDKKQAVKQFKKGMHENYAVYSCEWPYEKVEPKVICERLLSQDGHLPYDYKFFCVDGKVKFLFVATGRGVDTRFDFFDTEFNHIDVMQHYKNAETPVEKPKNFEKMIETAENLSKGFPFVRVDFYNINGQIIFGEYTFFHFGGIEEFSPEKYNLIFGEMIDTVK